MAWVSTYDAFVIGEGHNGLVAANYLTRKGMKTIVLEKRQVTKRRLRDCIFTDPERIPVEE